MKSAKNVVAFARQPERRNRHELAFLPAALEIVETPPSPTGRAIALTIALFFVLALTWASFGNLDIVASAPGRIVPSGRTKLVQPFEAGVVRAIHVHDGQSVAAGDVLIELDPTMNEAERDHLKSDLVAAQLDIARLQAATAEDMNVLANFHPPADVSPELVATQRRYLVQQTSEHRAKLAALDDQRIQKQAECASIAAAIEKLEAIIPVVEQRAQIHKTLLEHQTGSKLAYLESLQLSLENNKELAVNKSRLNEANAALAAITETRAQTEAEYNRTLFGELTEAERKAGGLAHELEKANERTKLQLLTAPVDGVVQQLAIHTVGGVVTPAQALLAVVPSDSRLEIEALVPNRDIGFVHAGQEAEIKIDTFNFTRYGLIKGEVLSVSPDAIARDKPQDKSSENLQGTEEGTSEPRGQEFVYAARVSLDRTQMNIENKFVNLSPGMAVTVEIKTGSQRMISYLLSPFMRFQQESLRER